MVESVKKSSNGKVMELTEDMEVKILTPELETELRGYLQPAVESMYKEMVDERRMRVAYAAVLHDALKNQEVKDKVLEVQMELLVKQLSKIEELQSNV